MNFKFFLYSNEALIMLDIYYPPTTSVSIFTFGTFITALAMLIIVYTD